MAHELAILSPEKVVLSIRIAGLGSRALAHVLDLAIYYIGLLFFGIYLVGMAAGDPAASEAVSTALGALIVIGWLFYFVILEGLWNGQTIGKKAAGIAVRMADATPITFAAAFGRNVLRPADFFPGMYFLGVLAMFTNSRSQRIGDMVSGTIVVHVKRPIPRFTPAPHAVSIHPLEEHVGELQGMTISEYMALRRLCDRFPELSQSTQQAFLKEVWQPIARRRGVPEISSVHPLSLAEAVVMKYGRTHGLL